jgi:glycosyltransferase involved in cell wall biosynthesis
MRPAELLLIEQFEGGHHSNYVRALWPALQALRAAGVLSGVTLAATERHARALAPQLDRSDPSLRLLPCLRAVGPDPTPAQRLAIARDAARLVARLRPQALIGLSADYDLPFNALRHLCAPWAPWPARSAAVIHYGYPRGEACGWREHAKRLAYRSAWAHSAWQRLLLVNPVVHEDLRADGDALAERTTLLPDPVPEPVRHERHAARRRLGLPADGRLIGFVGMMDRRKAIPELCAAFERAALPETRLLLAGALDAGFRTRIEASHRALLDDGRIVLLDRRLSDEELGLGYAACDALALLQHRRLNLSANLLKALSHGRPVLVDDVGYGAMMVRRFHVGATCDVGDPDSIAQGLARLLRHGALDTQYGALARLLRFHSPHNFARTLLAAVEPQAARVLGAPLGWDAVCPSAPIAAPQVAAA